MFRCWLWEWKIFCYNCETWGKKVYGLDLGEKGLNFAKKQALKKKYCSKIKYIKGSLLNIPFKNNYFDVIFSNGVVHHTANYNKCISDLVEF